MEVEEYARTSWYSVTFRKGVQESIYTIIENYDANADHSNFEFVDGDGLDEQTKDKILEAIETHALKVSS